MLSEIVDNPDLQKYMTTVQAGRILFLEGDDSEDLYVLVSGELEILKGNMKIRRISEKGALFGEMSFLLGNRRTATVKAVTDARALRIPKEEITTFLAEFPNVAKKITEILALRLNETTQILFGLKEFCDQLPDAVILTDKTGRILTWNSAAEKLYGRDWEEIRNRPVEEIYEEPETYRTFIEEVQSRYSVREKILKIRHPEKGTRYISTSTTILYDGQHNYQGVISLGRDVTAVKKLETRYRRIRRWMLPGLLFLCLLGGAFFYGYPSLRKGPGASDVKRHLLRNRLARDYLLLKSLLAVPLEKKDRRETTRVMKDFFNLQEEAPIPYTGIVLLDTEKKVFDAYSITPGVRIKEMLGSSYSGIDFQGSDRSLHRVLTVFRRDRDHPMGRRSLEVAFQLKRDSRVYGWLVFQMNTDLLQSEYHVDKRGLIAFQFKGS